MNSEEDELLRSATMDNWPFPTELPKPLPSKPIPFNPQNHEDAPW